MTDVSCRHDQQPQPVYDRRASVLVLAVDAGRGTEGGKAVEAAGARLIGPILAADLSGPFPIADMVLLELEGADDAAAQAAVARARQEMVGGARIVASFAPEQIDLVAGALLPGPAQLLCVPQQAERVAAVSLQLAERARGTWMHDVSREAESERLRHVQEEVARIAEALTRLTRAEPARESAAVRAKVPDYRGPEPQLMGDATAPDIRSAIRARRLRAQFFDELLFADPAWDMLLDLYAAHLEGLRVSVSSLCIAAAVPPTTALRWISTMHEAGLFERQADPDDRRRAYVRLSQAALEAMRRFTAAIRRAGLWIP